MASFEDFALPEDPRELRGTCIALPDITTLEAYETALTETYLPEYYATRGSGRHEIWLGREPLHTLLKPEHFYGRTGSIVVAHMINPVQELIAYRKNTIRENSKHAGWYEDRMIGMYISGELFSTGRGSIGSLATRVWIWPRHMASTSTTHSSYTRIIEKPRQRSEGVEEVILESKEIAEEVIKHALQHPYLGSFEASR